MNKYINISRSMRIGGTILGAFLCAIGMALGQSHSIAQDDTKNGISHGFPQPMSRADYAHIVKQRHLDDVSKAALYARDYTAAEGYARQSMTLGMGSGMSQEILVEALDGQGKTEELISIYKDMWNEGETSPNYMLPYALQLLKSGQWAQAVAAYNRALPYINQGELLQGHSDFSPAVPRTKELATAIHIGLGVTYLNGNDVSGRYQNDKAMLHFRQAIALAPDNALANYQYGVGLMRVGSPVAAKAAFQKAARLGQNDQEQVGVTKAAQAALQTHLQRLEYLPPVAAK